MSVKPLRVNHTPSLIHDRERVHEGLMGRFTEGTDDPGRVGAMVTKGIHLGLPLSQTRDHVGASAFEVFDDLSGPFDTRLSDWKGGREGRGDGEGMVVGKSTTEGTMGGFAKCHGLSSRAVINTTASRSILEDSLAPPLPHVLVGGGKGILLPDLDDLLGNDGCLGARLGEEGSVQACL